MEINTRKVCLLIGSLLVALVPFFEHLDAWSEAFTTSSVAVLAGILGGVLLAWIGQSPIKRP